MPKVALSISDYDVNNLNSSKVSLDPMLNFEKVSGYFFFVNTLQALEVEKVWLFLVASYLLVAPIYLNNYPI